jgi:pimeloyl-ACP methyl ester carboxylesterase
VPEVTEQTAQLLDQPVFWRSAAGDGTPVLYVHGVPTSSDDWLPFLRATGGVAPDLPGFGRSGKRGDGDFTIDGYADFLEAFCDLAGLDRMSLVVHDWGAVGLAFAQRFPERIERLVIMDAVPFLPGYRWHRIARLWRTPGVGEVVMGLTTKPTFRLASREANATPGPLPDAMVRSVMAHLDQGTQRAILRLYRSSPPDRLAAAGARLGELTAPALVVWGDRDPYIDPRFAELYAKRLPCAEVLRVPDAGHWPWLDRPDLVERIAAFLRG